MKPVEDDKTPERWLNALRRGDGAEDRLDDALAKRLRWEARCDDAADAPSEADLDRLRQQFQFRVRREGLGKKTAPTSRAPRWLAVAATLALGVVLVPLLLDQTGPTDPGVPGQTKALGGFTFEQTAPGEFTATFVQADHERIAESLIAALKQQKIEYLLDRKPATQRITFVLDSAQLTALRADLSSLGIRIDQQGRWSIAFSAP